MNLSEARAALEIEAQAASAPSLTEIEVTHLLRHMATLDAAGKAPADGGWEPTYDETLLTYAAYRAWLMKAGKVAGMVSYQADGARFDAGQLEAQCRNQAAEIRKRLVFSAAMRDAAAQQETATA